MEINTILSGSITSVTLATSVIYVGAIWKNWIVFKPDIFILKLLKCQIFKNKTDVL